MSSAVPSKRIGITMGDPCGIGPEIVLRLLHHLERTRRVLPLALYGDAGVLRRVADGIGLPWPKGLDCVSDPSAAGPAPVLVETQAASLNLSGLRPGRIQPEAGKAAYAWIRQAARDALAGRLAALVTGPIHKQAMRLAGMNHPGHTELLAEITGARRVAMMFVAPELTVTLATIHMALRAVPKALTPEGLLDKLQLTHAACRTRLGRAPRIGVLALNPHAGEGGRFGDEERRILHPAIERARALGMDIAGPLVPDAALTAEQRGRCDAFLAMYHDQALIPFKMLAFDHGVNVTLGLPFPRTSVDHGTAFDIAWQGKARPDSLVAAVSLAAELAAPPGEGEERPPSPRPEREPRSGGGSGSPSPRSERPETEPHDGPE